MQHLLAQGSADDGPGHRPHVLDVVPDEAPDQGEVEHRVGVVDRVDGSGDAGGAERRPAPRSSASREAKCP